MRLRNIWGIPDFVNIDTLRLRMMWGISGAYQILLKLSIFAFKDVRHINAYQIFKNLHSLHFKYGVYWGIPEFVNIITLRLMMMRGIPDFFKIVTLFG